ncbi:hypothetical protein DRE_04728 [Drechslerella stenobrocha 248]|uniref:CMP/dCMP-type deaminase domain-containing protein n=1 Tax=Drechslerella stenobrocha 248 TaxID=1043628 RepID=W7IA47_9PEZI|nr:hypothetical protein DRE_04728 [Drechslerella stenobrocha 248]
MSDPTTTRIHGLTTAEIELLGERSAAAKELSYSPYSHFRVGCAVLCEGGEIVLGANIENASYPVTICAERTALSRARLEGRTTFRALAVSTDISPPGKMRRLGSICEFCRLDTPVFMFDKTGDYKVLTLEQLLPMSFGPDHLKKVEQGGQ